MGLCFCAASKWRCWEGGVPWFSIICFYFFLCLKSQPSTVAVSWDRSLPPSPGVLARELLGGSAGWSVDGQEQGFVVGEVMEDGEAQTDESFLQRSRNVPLKKTERIQFNRMFWGATGFSSSTSEKSAGFYLQTA